MLVFDRDATWCHNAARPRLEFVRDIYFSCCLGKIFGPKREEDGSCRKLHNAELRNLYSSHNIVKVIIQGG